MIMMFALLLAAPAAAPAAIPPVVADCDAHKFETIVHTTVDGKPKNSRVKLCGKVGQSDADWLHTLKDAVEKVGLNAGMSAEAKDQVIAALNVEIARLSPSAEATPPPTPTIIAPPPAVVALPPPPFPSTNIAPVEYSALPPLPAPLPAPSVVARTAAAAVPVAPRLPAPRLSFRCLAMNSGGAEGPCDLLERDMLVTVRADEDVAPGTSLRFLRRGDNRAEIELTRLRRGQTQRFALPPRVCQGVSGSRVEIQVVRASRSGPQVVDSRGPFDLRC